MHKDNLSRNKLMKHMREECLERDHGCVFCYLKYRAEDHIPLQDYDLHFYHGKAYAMCEYHAHFMNPANASYYAAQRAEMERILDEYLNDKADPEVVF